MQFNRIKMIKISIIIVITNLILIVGFVNAQDKEYKIHEPTSLVYPPFKHAPVHKAGKLHLLALMALIGRTDVVPDEPGGIAGTRLKSTDDPLNINDDDDLTIYALNSGQNNIIYNSSMQTLDVYEGKTRHQKLSRPKGIAATADGEVWISDTGHDRVVKLHNPGSYLQFSGAFGKKGSKPGEFSAPGGIAVDGSGSIYVSDTGNDRIQIFDLNMKFQRFLTQESDTGKVNTSLFRPDAIALTGLGFSDTYFDESFIVVIDLNNTRIRKYSPDGQFVSGVNSTDYGYQRVYLTSAAIDFYCNIWITDMLNHCIHKFDRNLNYITSFGHIGEDDNEFFEPRAVFVGKKFGQVFILDKYSAQYFHIGTDIMNMNVSLMDSTVQFEFLLTEQSRVNAWIEKGQGNRVDVLASNKIFPLGKTVFSWKYSQFKHKSGLQSYRKQTDDSSGLIDSVVRKKLSGHDSTVVLSGIMNDTELFKLIIEARTTYRYSRYFTKKIEIEFAI